MNFGIYTIQCVVQRQVGLQNVAVSFVGEGVPGSGIGVCWSCDILCKHFIPQRVRLAK